MNKYYKTYLLLKMYKQEDLKDEDSMTLEQIAYQWVPCMYNKQGQKGEYWTLAQTTAVKESHTMNYDKYIWYITMNMMYVDYLGVIEHFDLDPESFCCYMADAFLDDQDAIPAEEKIREYYEHIVKH